MERFVGRNGLLIKESSGFLSEFPGRLVRTSQTVFGCWAGQLRKCQAQRKILCISQLRGFMRSK